MKLQWIDVVVVMVTAGAPCPTEVQPDWCIQMRPSDCYTVSDICCDQCAEYVYDPQSDCMSSFMYTIHALYNTSVGLGLSHREWGWMRAGIDGRMGKS